MRTLRNSLSLRFNDHFLRWTSVSRYQNVSVLDFIAAEVIEVVVTTGTIGRAKLQSNHHHQQTKPDALPVAQPAVSNHYWSRISSAGRMPFLSLSRSNEGQAYVCTWKLHSDRPSQEGHEDVASKLGFLVPAPEADLMPVVTRPSEGTRPEPTSAMVTRSRAREG